ncbi:hypothetical protein J4216_00305 [Candidatus Woesearchaeota archaeon]|nr:hypothetical protein [Candidatus Woesearchaeota archaeon]
MKNKKNIAKVTGALLGTGLSFVAADAFAEKLCGQELAGDVNVVDLVEVKTEPGIGEVVSLKKKNFNVTDTNLSRFNGDYGVSDVVVCAKDLDATRSPTDPAEKLLKFGIGGTLVLPWSFADGEYVLDVLSNPGVKLGGGQTLPSDSVVRLNHLEHRNGSGIPTTVLSRAGVLAPVPTATSAHGLNVPMEGPYSALVKIDGLDDLVKVEGGSYGLRLEPLSHTSSSTVASVPITTLRLAGSNLITAQNHPIPSSLDVIGGKNKVRLVKGLNVDTGYDLVVSATSGKFVDFRVYDPLGNQVADTIMLHGLPATGPGSAEHAKRLKFKGDSFYILAGTYRNDRGNLETDFLIVDNRSGQPVVSPIEPQGRRVKGIFDRTPGLVGLIGLEAGYDSLRFKFGDSNIKYSGLDFALRGVLGYRFRDEFSFGVLASLGDQLFASGGFNESLLVLGEDNNRGYFELGGTASSSLFRGSSAQIDASGSLAFLLHFMDLDYDLFKISEKSTGVRANASLALPRMILNQDGWSLGVVDEISIEYVGVGQTNKTFGLDVKYGNKTRLINELGLVVANEGLFDASLRYRFVSDPSLELRDNLSLSDLDRLEQSQASGVLDLNNLTSDNIKGHQLALYGNLKPAAWNGHYIPVTALVPLAGDFRSFGGSVGYGNEVLVVRLGYQQVRVSSQEGQEIKDQLGYASLEARFNETDLIALPRRTLSNLR